MTELYLAGDCGGTKARVVIASQDSILARGEGGPCNLQTVGHAQAINVILEATFEAIGRLPDYLKQRFEVECSERKFSKPLFKALWLALAGVNQPSDAEEFRPAVARAFAMGGIESNVRVTNDTDLLASPALKHDDTDAAIALIAGTGTNGMAFSKTENRSLERIGISRGWGYLLCDEGSAYSVGRLAVRSLLAYEDFRGNSKLYNTSTNIAQLNLHKDLMKQLKVDSAADLINKTYADHSDATQYSFSRSETNRKCWIAEACRVVFKYAFAQPPSKRVVDEILSDTLIAIPGDPTPNTMVQSTHDDGSQLEALRIAAQAVCPLVHMLVRLLGDRSRIKPETTTLTVGGGVISNNGYRSMLLEALDTHFGVRFRHVEIVSDAEGEGVQALAKQYKPSARVARITIHTPPQSPSKRNSLNSSQTLSPTSPVLSVATTSA
ncbi:hypothetical protein E3P92_00827 [Wallemia ichthyophaga]|uniref:N-acetylglucosamine kinase n=2 Tax=Wallemia ichthyophaga TaxID=245174 RepID=A0A4T0GNS1_WALIC|nr:N-acetyl-D-glucosamine kinase [Wallemia ichthyophaga EXF-994]TIA75115.1 hypothetical protein E3P91_00563 [Wallemia ichthyophaga]EOR02096.1 N-acetyl-D-glucosamine kinase [Wallemia ichthyophaga EXF-994]TIA83685.1 hypothetical protein E3P98_00554 [Wallemia ichthyophaga]TIA93770.1 hypothetical protein E3P97_00732 [Wallemia ichthyophaga]TIB02695.1 hypothetical protein E3P95_00781 [Wallemia ichthyophaga]